jgi:hypothetical protein
MHRAIFWGFLDDYHFIKNQKSATVPIWTNLQVWPVSVLPSVVFFVFINKIGASKERKQV